MSGESLWSSLSKDMSFGLSPRYYFQDNYGNILDGVYLTVSHRLSSPIFVYGSGSCFYSTKSDFVGTVDALLSKGYTCLSFQEFRLKEGGYAL